MGHSHCGVSSVGHRTPIATHCYGRAPARMLMRKGGVWEREGASLITKISQASGRKNNRGGAGVILLHRSERFFRGRRCLGFLKNLGKVLTANREEMTGGKGRWLSPWKGEGGGAQLDAKLGLCKKSLHLCLHPETLRGVLEPSELWSIGQEISADSMKYQRERSRFTSSHCRSSWMLFMGS